MKNPNCSTIELTVKSCPVFLYNRQDKLKQQIHSRRAN